MRVDLQGEWLRFQKTRSDQECVYSADPIEKGRHAVTIREIKENTSYRVWVHPGSVQSLASDLASFEESTSEVGDYISPTGRIKFNKVSRGDSKTCVVCNYLFEREEEAVSFYRRPTTKFGQGDTVWCHPNCLKVLIENITNIWEYENVILKEFGQSKSEGA